MFNNAALKNCTNRKRFNFHLRYAIAALLLSMAVLAIIWPNASAAGNDAQSHIGASGTNGLGAVAQNMPPPIGVQQEPPASVNAQTQSTDATLSAITIDGTDVPSFVTDQRYFNYGVASTTDTVTVAVTTTHDGANAIITPADSDNNQPGHQVNLTSGMNSITIAVTAEDGMTGLDNTLNVNRGVTETYGWKAVEDLDTIPADRDESHYGLTHHDGVFWTANRSTDKLHAYAADGTRDTTKDISLNADNGVPESMWTDGTHIYALDGVDNKTYTYRNSDGAHVSTKDFDLHSDNDDPAALASDGTTMWVADATDDKLYAYNLSDGTRTAQQQALEFDLVSNNADPRGLWTDGFTIWVSNANSGGSTPYILAYSAFDGDRMSSLDYNTLAGAKNSHPRDITATATTMFVLDDGNVKVYSYNHPRSPNTSLSGITIDGNSIPSFFPAGNSFEHGVAHDTPQVTIAATALHPQASVAITPADAVDTEDGHQVDLSAGRNAVTITVTAEDTTTKTYTVNVNQGVNTPLGWKAGQDFDALIR